ncbi:MAG: hypothetical protein ACT4PT_04405 [Methanobacteriota archaeon]
MALGPVEMGEILLSGVLFGLAAWLLYLKFDSRLNQTFALFLVLRGLYGISVAMRRAAESDEGRSFWLAIQGYQALALVPVLAYFAYVFLRGGRATAVRGMAVALIGGVALETVYFLDHCLVICSHAAGSLSVGPLGLFFYAVPLLYAAVGLVFAIQSTRPVGASRSDAFYLVSLGFVLNALLDSTLVLLPLASDGAASYFSGFPSMWSAVAAVVLPYGGAFVLAVAALVVHSRPLPQEAPYRNRTGPSWILAALAVLTGATTVSEARVEVLDADLRLFLILAWRAALVLLILFALVRRRLFDNDAAFRGGIHKGTVAAAFLVILFAVSQIAENYVDARLGIVMGGLVAGLLFFVSSRMESVAHRVSNGLVPVVDDDSRVGANRFGIYREQAEIVWADGAMSRRERLLLDRLRERLGIPLEDAARLEREAALAGYGGNATRARVLIARNKWN